MADNVAGGDVTFLAHMPLLRMASERVGFLGMTLLRLPWDLYDPLTMGAFEDHRRAYEATQPVFLAATLTIPSRIIRRDLEPKRGGFELKLPANARGMLEQLGLGFIARFHDRIVDRAAAALTLAAPATALPPAELSVTFAQVQDGCFDLQGQRMALVRVQGDADQEWLFLPDAAGAPLDDAAFARAEDLYQRFGAIEASPELRAALIDLIAAGAPVLSPADQLTLATMTLESLLLPEVRKGLGATFAGRIARLLARDEAHREALKTTARALYDARSANVHSEAPRSAEVARELERDASAQRILAASIAELARRLDGGRTLEQIRTDLDGDADASDPVAISEPDGLRSMDRISLPLRGPILAVAPSLAAPSGSSIVWAPLVGLGAREALRFDPDAPSPVIMPCTPAEIIEMEDRDVRRDFAASALMESQTFAVLGVGAMAVDSPAGHEVETALVRQRDLAVAALRIAGFDGFHDPELLGAFLYREAARFRRATVFRQTLIMRLRNEPAAHIEPADVGRLAPVWRLLDRYATAPPHPAIEHVLRLVRRGSDRLFLPDEVRATLLFAALEAMFGRSRAPKAAVQVHDLAAAILDPGSPALAWFRSEGRAFRNTVAHGGFASTPDADTAIGLLHALVKDVAPAFIAAWMEVNEPLARPSDVLERYCLTRLEGRTP